MASNGHITAEQLQRVVEAIMNKVLKAESVDNKTTIKLGDLDIQYDSETGLFTFTSSNGGTLTAQVPVDGGINRQVATGSTDGDLDVSTLNVGVMKNIAELSGQMNKSYCLPAASSRYSSKAMHPTTGGGMLLSTRYRAYEPLIYTPDPDQGASVVAKPYMFTTVSGATVVNISFEEEVNAVNEYWIDLEFLNTVPPSVTFQDFNGGKSIVWTGDGEPDWSTLGGRRIQIHILSGMASYVISSVDESQSDENVEPTE